MTAVPDDGFAERTEKVEQLQRALGHSFGDRRLLREALTHTSYRNETPHIDYDNERLEFLGDSIIGCIVSDLLWHRYRTDAEGTLTRYRALLVSAESLAEQARQLDLGQCLRLGRGEELTGGRSKLSLLADAFESLIAALYLDGGYEKAYEFLADSLGQRISLIAVTQRRAHFKAKVQELVQGQLRTTPRYRVVAETGPDHEKEFEVVLTVRGEEYGRGNGRSKKEAEEEAAQFFWDRYETGETEFPPKPKPGGAPAGEASAAASTKTK